MKLENIDTLTTAGKARVMQLAAEGRKVAVRIVDEWAPRVAWVEKTDPDWNWRVDTFAIIVQQVGPDEVWVSVDSSGEPLLAFGSDAKAGRARESGYSVVRYRRVEE